ncbi:MAG: FecR domain-containing protein, partial [Planctomycetota bacterium]|nr:FecR domain-containing protein [Planctomycetota bacterium]
TVEVQSGGQGDWVPAVVGMRFGEGTSICVGFKSGTILEFGDSSMVMLKDLAQVRVDRLFKDENAIDAQLSLTVGRVAVHVRKQEIRSEFRVSTPKLTAAVKGSFLDFEKSPDYGVQVYSAYGDIVVTDLWGASQQIGETMSAAEEAALVAQQAVHWNDDVRGAGSQTGKELATMILRQLGYTITEMPQDETLKMLLEQIPPDAPTYIRRQIGRSVEASAYSIDNSGKLRTGGNLPANAQSGRSVALNSVEQPTGWNESSEVGYGGIGDSGVATQWTSPVRLDDMSRESSLPAYSGSQFGAACDQLYAMGYSGLAYYLRNDGSTCAAVDDASCFSSSYSSQPAKVEWMW